MSQQAWLNAAVEAAQVAGQVLLDWQGRFSVREKSRANLVTDADEASQTAIVSRLRQHFPDHSFLGEENLNERGSSHEA
ncbi:MAG: inositol monophosphatase family protein, partial [Planctomyces sp.]